MQCLQKQKIQDNLQEMKSRKFIFTIILTLIFFAIYSYNLPKSLISTSDFGRDMYQTIKIAQGDLVLLGSKMNLGGYFAGPYLYYLLAPAFLLGKFDINSVLYFHTFLFAAAIGFFFWVAYHKLNPYKALLGAVFLGLMPIFIISARYPSNGYSYLAILLALFTYIFFLNFQSRLTLFILGLLTGIILNIHPISSLALIFSSFYIFLSLKKKWLFAFFLGAIFITFIPIFAFEITHDFVMTKDTFVNQSYRTFTEDGNTPQFWRHENKFVSSFLFISDKFKKLISLEPIFYFGLIIFVLRSKWLQYLSISMILSLFLLIIVLRFHFEDHYIFSVALFIPFAASLILLRSKLWFFLLIITIFQVQTFPTNLYQNSMKSVSFNDIEQAVKFSLDHKLLSKDIPFNLIQITDAYGLIPTGFEYRFFFRKYGLYPNSEYDYKSAKILLIFSETPYYDIDRFKMWATEEFGREHFTKKEVYHVGNIDIYRVKKE